MILRKIHLTYDLVPGWLAPYVESLMQGRALARACKTCGHVSYPPVHSCGCLSPEPHWVPLNGKAKILFRTDGADGSFALVRFAGAQTMAVVQLSNLPSDAVEGALASPEGQLPTLRLKPLSPGLPNERV